MPRPIAHMQLAFAGNVYVYGIRAELHDVLVCVSVNLNVCGTGKARCSHFLALDTAVSEYIIFCVLDANMAYSLVYLCTELQERAERIHGTL